MSDAAAFFAKKKKKKKTYKFNANTIDASTITSAVHVDAPALSTEIMEDTSSTIGALTSLAINSSSNDPSGAHMLDDSQWDDAALAAKTSRKGFAVAVPSGATTKELSETKAALSLRRQTKVNEEEEIAEKLRVEETKAKLAAAREGMEREAQRIKDEKDRKDQESTATASRFGAAALEISGGTGGIWVPSRLRNGGSGSGMPTGWGSKMSTTQSKNVDTECENAFPDLATADAIIEKQKQEQPAYKVPTKTPVGGGGAYWGASSVPTTRPKLNLKKKSVVKEAETNEDEDTRKEYETFGTSQLREQSDLVISEPSPPTDDQTKKEPENLGIAETMPAPVSIKSNKKKKKKNLSTFKK